MHKQDRFVRDPGTCARVFHTLLPYLTALGVTCVISAIVMFCFVGPNATDPGLQTAAVITAAAGNSILGLSSIGRNIWKLKSGNAFDELDNWLVLTFLFLLVGSLFAAFNLDVWGIGIGSVGVIFAAVAGYYFAVRDKFGARIDYTESETRSNNGQVIHQAVQNQNDAYRSVNETGSDDPLLPRRESVKDTQESYDPEMRVLFQIEESPEYDGSLAPDSTQSESWKMDRRLASESSNTSAIVSTIGITVASLLLWFLFFRGQSIQDKPRRRTTIIKKRPTFVKSKRRATHKPTLSRIRSEGNLARLSLS